MSWCIVNETDHRMNFYSEQLALYFSFATDRGAHFNNKGVNYIFYATLQTLS